MAISLLSGVLTAVIPYLARKAVDLITGDSGKKPIPDKAPPLNVADSYEKNLNVPNLIQGNNECGPTALAMVMKSYGTNWDYHELSDTVGHGPIVLKEIAQKNGFTVRQENNGSLADLAALVDKGIPALTLGIYGGKDPTKAHWMVVTGYKRNDAGKITHIYFNDPNKSTPQCWTADKFVNEFWKNNVIPGGHNYYMAMAPKGSAKEAALLKLLPQDKVSPSFALTMDVIHKAEIAFYKTETGVSSWLNTFKDTVKTVASAAKSIWNGITRALA